MPRPEHGGSPPPEVRGTQREKPKNIREMVFLAEQAAESGIRVLPGKEWGVHYPQGGAARTEKLQAILDGRVEPGESAADLQPDALVYNAEDIDTLGIGVVSARIRDCTAQLRHYDYERFANFVGEMRGKDVSLEAVQALYDGVAMSRIQKKVHDAYGSTGKRQMETALRQEAHALVAGMGNRATRERVLAALKLDWLCERLGFAKSDDRDRALASLSDDERVFFDRLKDSYYEYVQNGSESAYKRLVDEMREVLPAMEALPPVVEQEGDTAEEQGEESESMQELRESLEQFMDAVGPPGTSLDSAIPPEDNDEYHTPPPFPGESREQAAARPMFEIEPPLAGHYASGRKSYYDRKRKVWSKRKQLGQYAGSVGATERHHFRGRADQGVISLPLPNGYAFDSATFNARGAEARLMRDQNGCFYLEARGLCEFDLEFGKEDTPFIGPPRQEDIEPIHAGRFSEESESVLGGLAGNILDNAERLRSHVQESHYYPGGGDLQAAQALQYKLREESDEDTYIPNLEASEYLECYSSNTLFIALARRAGISARLVVGHRVEGAKDGKSVIDQNTGHAWAEVWDGSLWRRFDATPLPKPQDHPKQEQHDSAPEADDGGVEKPQQSEGEGEPQQSSPQQGEPSSSPSQLQDMSEADVAEAAKQLESAKESMQKMQQTMRDLRQKIQDAKQFSDLAEIQKVTEKSDLLDDMKEQVERATEAKENEMKQELADKLDEMVEDGFLNEKEQELLEQELEKADRNALDDLLQRIERENKLHEQYESIKEEVMPLVDQWFEYFVERLPKHEDPEYDEDSRTRQGAFDRRSITKPRNLMFGTIKNPRVIHPSLRPRFLASIMVDVSGSMQGDKLQNARKMLIFYSELFSRIHREFGYIRFSISTFSDGVTEIKAFDQEYDAPTRYAFTDGRESTIKVRLMTALKAQGGTNMLDAIKQAAGELQRETREYPDYASALYFNGDGEDTQGNSEKVRAFLETNDREHGFGEHMRSAILLGDERNRQELAKIFGDEHTAVASDFDELVQQSMERFNADISEYLKN